MVDIGDVYWAEVSWLSVMITLDTAMPSLHSCIIVIYGPDGKESRLLLDNPFDYRANLEAVRGFREQGKDAALLIGPKRLRGADLKQVLTDFGLL